MLRLCWMAWFHAHMKADWAILERFPAIMAAVNAFERCHTRWPLCLHFSSWIILDCLVLIKDVGGKRWVGGVEWEYGSCASVFHEASLADWPFCSCLAVPQNGSRGMGENRSACGGNPLQIACKSAPSGHLSFSSTRVGCIPNLLTVHILLILPTKNASLTSYTVEINGRYWTSLDTNTCILLNRYFVFFLDRPVQRSCHLLHKHTHFANVCDRVPTLSLSHTHSVSLTHCLFFLLSSFPSLALPANPHLCAQNTRPDARTHVFVANGFQNVSLFRRNSHWWTVMLMPREMADE